MNDLIIDKLKETMQLQNNIKLRDLEYTTKRGKHLRDAHEGNLSLKDADEEQSKSVDELKSRDKGRKPVEKKVFF